MSSTTKSWLAAAILGLAAGACSGTSKVVGVDDSMGGSGGSGLSDVAGDTALTAGTGAGPNKGALGDTCVPADESVSNFAGFDAQEVNIDDHAATCASQFCVVNHFQGRASCPYGQTVAGMDCFVPGSSMTVVTVPVKPQLKDRRTAVASICSCQCAGYGPGPYCTCPDSMECDHLVDKLAIPTSGFDYSGSYCIPLGSAYDRTDTAECSGTDCGDSHPY